MSSPFSTRSAKDIHQGHSSHRNATVLFGPDGVHRPLPLSVSDMVHLRQCVAELEPPAIDRLITSWTMALVHLPPSRPLYSLIPCLVSDMSLSHTDLSRRARNSLNRSGWWTLREVAQASLAEVATARSVGTSALTEFVSAYIRHALTGSIREETSAPHGRVIQWLADVLGDAQRYGTREIDIHIVERSGSEVRERESLLGLELRDVVREIQRLNIADVPEPRVGQT